MKRILNIFIAIFVYLNVNAQITHFHYGIVGGPSSTWLLNSNISIMGTDVKYKSTFGWSLGIFASWNISQMSSISVEAIYSK